MKHQVIPEPVHVRPALLAGGTAIMKRTRKKILDELRAAGEQAAREGKSIEAFYTLDIRYKENYRAAYEIGYRIAKAEMRKEGAP